jgi:hypothetical protein
LADSRPRRDSTVQDSPASDDTGNSPDSEPAGYEADSHNVRNDSKKRPRKPRAARTVAKASATYPSTLLKPPYHIILEDALGMQLDWHDDRGTSGQLRGGADAENDTDASR